MYTPGNARKQTRAKRNNVTSACRSTNNRSRLGWYNKQAELLYSTTVVVHMFTKKNNSEA